VNFSIPVLVFTPFCFRFYDVDEGSVTIGGVDVREFDPSWLRGNCIGFINQEPVLFATSIMENIRYGKPDASDNEVLPCLYALPYVIIIKLLVYYGLCDI
jgi:ABC-type multidrug transport system fused ATPase/permease subunit